MEEDLTAGMRCIKYMLFMANFMFMIVGFLLISIGSAVKYIYYDFETFMETRYFSPSHLMVAIGILIFVVALFGCVGAIRESVFMVNLYALFLILILILELSACIAAYAMRYNIKAKIEDNMWHSMENYKADTYDVYAWDFMQEALGCCGVHNASDWAKNGNAKNETWYVPNSCCKNQKCDYIYENGCSDVLSYVVSECALLLGVGALCVSFIQILGIVFANMLAKSIRRIKSQILVQRQEARRQLYEQLARGNNEKVTPVIYESTEA